MQGKGGKSRMRPTVNREPTGQGGKRKKGMNQLELVYFQVKDYFAESTVPRYAADTSGHDDGSARARAACTWSCARRRAAAFAAAFAAAAFAATAASPRSWR